MTVGQVDRLVHLRELANRQSRSGPGTPIITFISGKGGTGKSFLTVNLAYALSRAGKKILVIDFDPNFAGLHVMVNVFPEATLPDYFSHKALLRDIVYRYSDTLHFMFGEAGTREMRNITRSEIYQWVDEIDRLGEGYDYIFVDTGSGMGEQAIALLGRTEQCCIVANPEPTAVMDAYVIVKLLRANNVAAHVSAIINKSASYEEGETAFKNLKKAIDRFLKHPVSLLGVVKNSETIRRSLMEQEILTEKGKEKPEAERLRELAADIANLFKMASINHSSEK